MVKLQEMFQTKTLCSFYSPLSIIPAPSAVSVFIPAFSLVFVLIILSQLLQISLLIFPHLSQAHSINLTNQEKSNEYPSIVAKNLFRKKQKRRNRKKRVGEEAILNNQIFQLHYQIS